MSLSPSSMCVCVLLCLSRMLPRRQSSFPQFFFHTHRNGFYDPHNRDNAEFCRVSQEGVWLRYVRRDLTFVHSSVVRTSTFLQALPGIELSGLQGSPSPIFRTSVSQESLRETRLATRLISASRGINRHELICFLVRASNHSFAASQFQLSLICIVVSDQANFTKGHKLFVVVFVTHISVCWSLCHELEPIEYLHAQ